jgi:hypothetical protein
MFATFSFLAESGSLSKTTIQDHFSLVRKL